MKKKLYPWHTWQFIALPIFAVVMLCVLVFGIINQPITDPNDIITIDPNSELVRSLNILYWYGKPLGRAGVSPDDVQICMRWAFGDDYLLVRGCDLNDRWNTKHSDIFIMYGSDEINETFYKVGKAWITTQEAN